MLLGFGGGIRHAGHAWGYRYGGPTSTPNPIPSLIRAGESIPIPYREGRREDGERKGEKRETYRGASYPDGSEGDSMMRGWGGRLHSLSPRGNRGGPNTWGFQGPTCDQAQDRRSQAPGTDHVEWGWEKRWARPTGTGEEQTEEGRRHHQKRRRRRHRRRRRLRRRRRQRR